MTWPRLFTHHKLNESYDSIRYIVVESKSKMSNISGDFDEVLEIWKETGWNDLISKWQINALVNHVVYIKEHGEYDSETFRSFLTEKPVQKDVYYELWNMSARTLKGQQNWKEAKLSVSDKQYWYYALINDMCHLSINSFKAKYAIDGDLFSSIRYGSFNYALMFSYDQQMRFIFGDDYKINLQTQDVSQQLFDSLDVEFNNDGTYYRPVYNGAPYPFDWIIQFNPNTNSKSKYLERMKDLIMIQSEFCGELGKKSICWNNPVQAILAFATIDFNDRFYREKVNIQISDLIHNSGSFDDKKYLNQTEKITAITRIEHRNDIMLTKTLYDEFDLNINSNINADLTKNIPKKTLNEEQEKFIENLRKGVADGKYTSHDLVRIINTRLIQSISACNLYETFIDYMMTILDLIKDNSSVDDTVTSIFYLFKLVIKTYFQIRPSVKEEKVNKYRELAIATFASIIVKSTFEQWGAVDAKLEPFNLLNKTPNNVHVILASLCENIPNYIIGSYDFSKFCNRLGLICYLTLLRLEMIKGNITPEYYAVMSLSILNFEMTRSIMPYKDLIDIIQTKKEKEYLVKDWNWVHSTYFDKAGSVYQPIGWNQGMLANIAGSWAMIDKKIVEKICALIGIVAKFVTNSDDSSGVLGSKDERPDQFLPKVNRILWLVDVIMGHSINFKKTYYGADGEMISQFYSKYGVINPKEKFNSDVSLTLTGLNYSSDYQSVIESFFSDLANGTATDTAYLKYQIKVAEFNRFYDNLPMKKLDFLDLLLTKGNTEFITPNALGEYTCYEETFNVPGRFNNKIRVNHQLYLEKWSDQLGMSSLIGKWFNSFYHCQMPLDVTVAFIRGFYLDNDWFETSRTNCFIGTLIKLLKGYYLTVNFAKESDLTFSMKIKLLKWANKSVIKCNRITYNVTPEIKDLFTSFEDNKKLYKSLIKSTTTDYSYGAVYNTYIKKYNLLKVNIPIDVIDLKRKSESPIFKLYFEQPRYNEMKDLYSDIFKKFLDANTVTFTKSCLNSLNKLFNGLSFWAYSNNKESNPIVVLAKNSIRYGKVTAGTQGSYNSVTDKFIEVFVNVLKQLYIGNHDNARKIYKKEMDIFRFESVLDQLPYNQGSLVFLLKSIIKDSSNSLYIKLPIGEERSYSGITLDKQMLYLFNYKTKDNNGKLSWIIRHKFIESTNVRYIFEMSDDLYANYQGLPTNLKDEIDIQRQKTNKIKVNTFSLPRFVRFYKYNEGFYEHISGEFTFRKHDISIFIDYSNMPLLALTNTLTEAPMYYILKTILPTKYSSVNANALLRKSFDDIRSLFEDLFRMNNTVKARFNLAFAIRNMFYNRKLEGYLQKYHDQLQLMKFKYTEVKSTISWSINKYNSELLIPVNSVMGVTLIVDNINNNNVLPKIMTYRGIRYVIPSLTPMELIGMILLFDHFANDWLWLSWNIALAWEIYIYQDLIIDTDNYPNINERQIITGFPLLEGLSYYDPNYFSFPIRITEEHKPILTWENISTRYDCSLAITKGSISNTIIYDESHIVDNINNILIEVNVRDTPGRFIKKQNWWQLRKDSDIISVYGDNRALNLEISDYLSVASILLPTQNGVYALKGVHIYDLNQSQISDILSSLDNYMKGNPTISDDEKLNNIHTSLEWFIYTHWDKHFWELRNKLKNLPVNDPEIPKIQNLLNSQSYDTLCKMNFGIKSSNYKTLCSMLQREYSKIINNNSLASDGIIRFEMFYDTIKLVYYVKKWFSKDDFVPITATLNLLMIWFNKLKISSDPMQSLNINKVDILRRIGQDHINMLDNNQSFIYRGKTLKAWLGDESFKNKETVAADFFQNLSELFDKLAIETLNFLSLINTDLPDEWDIDIDKMSQLLTKKSLEWHMTHQLTNNLNDLKNIRNLLNDYRVTECFDFIIKNIEKIYGVAIISVLPMIKLSVIQAISSHFLTVMGYSDKIFALSQTQFEEIKQLQLDTLLITMYDSYKNGDYIKLLCIAMYLWFWIAKGYDLARSMCEDWIKNKPEFQRDRILDQHPIERDIVNKWRQLLASLNIDVHQCTPMKVTLS